MAVESFAGLYEASPTSATDTKEKIVGITQTGAVRVALENASGTAALGTAGTPSAAVQSVQGVSGGIPVDQGIGGTFTTLTRPANTTAYAANDSISDNATAGSVTALSATISSVNDAPFILTHIDVYTTDTGLGAAVSIRAYIYNSDPTASSGVGGGDNAAFSNKQAGRIATFVGTFIAASDGGVAHLAPENTNPPVLYPTSGAKTLFIQFQTLGAFTPSANSTTLIAKARGVQLRA